MGPQQNSECTHAHNTRLGTRARVGALAWITIAPYVKLNSSELIFGIFSHETSPVVFARRDIVRQRIQEPLEARTLYPYSVSSTRFQ